MLQALAALILTAPLLAYSVAPLGLSPERFNERSTEAGSGVVFTCDHAASRDGIKAADPMSEQPELLGKIELRGPPGRLDHLALDVRGQRLFIANMANSSLDIVDLRGSKLLRQIPDQKDIQGIAYAADLDRIFVGNGAGSCNVFDGRNYRLLKSFELLGADNVRYQPETGHV